jgi:2-polyprenyl-6-methoxyphenol hydroxylase-like FAD-dependent oxidoreductase
MQDSHNTNSVPVLIAGAGPTGLALALSLARRGVAFGLIDENQGRQASIPAPWSPTRAYWSSTI